MGFGNATLGGERATKILINGTELGKYSPMKNITGSINSIAYLVVHHNQPYYLYYIANENNYIKYLNDFEQIVSNFRVTKWCLVLNDLTKYSVCVIER